MKILDISLTCLIFFNENGRSQSIQDASKEMHKIFTFVCHWSLIYQNQQENPDPAEIV